MKDMIKNSFILLMITLIAGLLLGFVYENTKDVIAQRQEDDKKAAYSEVFKDASDFKPVDDFTTEGAQGKLSANGYSNESINELNAALSSSGEVMGYVFTITTKEGYGGDITFTLGIKNDGTVNGISILEISETAGLGMEADKILKPQFANKQVEKFEYTKTGSESPEQIDAISGATITTNAITNGVNAGLYYFNNNLGGAANE